MRTFLARSAAWALAALVGVTASAQTGGQDRPSDGHKDSQAQQDGSSQNAERTVSICGEVAGVTVVGETLVDYDTGRGVIADVTYLTILGSPTSEHKDGDSAHHGEDHSGKPDAHAGTDGTGNPSGRRSVYLIAVSPRTDVCRKDGHEHGNDHDRTADHKDDGGRKDEGVKRTATDAPSNQPSQAALMSLQLGDRVDVEFIRTSKDQGRAGPAGQGDNTNRNRHGRQHVVRGVARTIAILPESHDGSSGESKDKGASDTHGTAPEKKGSGAESGHPKSTSDK